MKEDRGNACLSKLMIPRSSVTRNGAAFSRTPARGEWNSLSEGDTECKKKIAKPMRTRWKAKGWLGWICIKMMFDAEISSLPMGIKPPFVNMIFRVVADLANRRNSTKETNVNLNSQISSVGKIKKSSLMFAETTAEVCGRQKP
jgi:hypothetical protein